MPRPQAGRRKSTTAVRKRQRSALDATAPDPAAQDTAAQVRGLCVPENASLKFILTVVQH
jgi:hypothetical protein